MVARSPQLRKLLLARLTLLLSSSSIRLYCIVLKEPSAVRTPRNASHFAQEAADPCWCICR